MPRCAWILIIALTAILHHAIGIPATVAFLLNTVLWVFATPAALIAVAALAAWHLTNYHAPRPERARRAAHT